VQILAALPQPAGERIPLREARGRLLAEHISSPVGLPVFDNSSMDGYTARAGEMDFAKGAFRICAGALKSQAAASVRSSAAWHTARARDWAGPPQRVQRVQRVQRAQWAQWSHSGA
jgi:molybdopterin biosynthesis enzyme